MQDLDGGLAVEAGVDFTGGIPEVINLEARTGDEEKKLFSLLKGVDQLKDERFLSSSLAGPSGMVLEARQVKIKEITSYTLCHRSGLNPSPPLSRIFFHEPSSVSLRCRGMIVPQIFILGFGGF